MLEIHGASRVLDECINADRLLLWNNALVDRPLPTLALCQESGSRRICHERLERSILLFQTPAAAELVRLQAVALWAL